VCVWEGGILNLFFLAKPFHLLASIIDTPKRKLVQKEKEYI
jgi:hypothetical protein